MTLETEISSNKQFAHAIDVMKHADTPLLVTGKAGTGKSTLLRHFVATSGLSCVVLAPTGVAAINAGGQTIHSFFGLPIRPLIPGDSEIKKFGKYHPKFKIMAKMDCLIIDEVSMLRADIIDAIDHALRLNLAVNRPFGGKKVIFFGDLFQLEPVMQNNEVERHLFTEVYRSHYFFDAHVFDQVYLPNLELTQVFRQKDPAFISLLDGIRTNTIGEEELKELNTRYLPEYEPAPEELSITLCTRNYMADSINDFMLSRLDGQPIDFKGSIEGEFNERNLPTSFTLTLKLGAQVVFLKNHVAGKYVNGSLGRIETLKPDKLEVRLEDGEVVELQKETWENKTYRFDDINKRIQTDVIGRFTQYPIKLAWAITIHKSQGLSFDKAIIDLGGGAFAHGQVYVALSRCRRIDGMYLRQQIRYKDVIVDERVVDYSRRNLID